jgi:hypothetical protein
MSLLLSLLFSCRRIKERITQLFHLLDEKSFLSIPVEQERTFSAQIRRSSRFVKLFLIAPAFGMNYYDCWCSQKSLIRYRRATHKLFILFRKSLESINFVSTRETNGMALAAHYRDSSRANVLFTESLERVTANYHLVIPKPLQTSIDFLFFSCSLATFSRDFGE